MASSQVASSSPWGKAKVVVPCSLEEIMTEQLASQLQEHESLPQIQTEEPFVQEAELLPVLAADCANDEDLAALLAEAGEEEGETHSDEVIARTMQLQFDREHNAMLDREANKVNGTSKVTLSFENYKTHHPLYEEEEAEEDEDYDETATKWEEKTPNIGTKGYTGSGKNITTKHDKVICGRKNAERLMEFPPEFESGDGEGIDMQLTNQVYNSLKAYTKTELKKKSRDFEQKEHSTALKAVDSKTRVLLFKLINSGLLESYGGCIAEGKESAVFEGNGGSLEGVEVPRKVAVKVFKTTLAEFRTREKYVHGDHRFAADDYKKKNPRKIMKLWAMKEVANLNRMRKFDVPCPRVVVLKKHVLVMSMIGDEKPAPKLHYAKLPAADHQDAYDQTVEIMKTLHNKCGLVHADLSAYNLLWHDGTVHVIDVSQSVELTHPQAFNFLLRDCANVSTHFQKKGVHGVLSPEHLFNQVTGLGIHGVGADFGAQVQRYDRERKECNIAMEQGYSQFGFDYFFEKTMEERVSDAASAPSTSLSTSPSHTSRKSLSALVQKYVQESDESSSSEEEESATGI